MYIAIALTVLFCSINNVTKLKNAFFSITRIMKRLFSTQVVIGLCLKNKITKNKK